MLQTRNWKSTLIIIKVNFPKTDFLDLIWFEVQDCPQNLLGLKCNLGFSIYLEARIIFLLKSELATSQSFPL